MKVSTHTAVFALVVAACLFITTYASILEQPPLSEKEYQTLFVEFLNRYDKKYEVGDFFSRYSTFRENLDWIRAFNADPSNTHTVEANIFADLKPSEWKQYMGLKFPQNWQEPDYELLENKDWSEIGHLKEVYSKYQDAPNAVDWVAANDVTPIRNQGACGSCFSFSSVGAIESLSLINNKTAQDEHFSVQDALDCTRGSPYYCQGCGGGFPSSVMAWVHDNQGICKDADYPYEGRAGSCRSTKCENVFSIDGYVGVSGYSEKTMARAAAINPLSIAITADTREFMYYKAGIINYCSVYSYQQPDHAVIIVGYNLETNIDNNDGKSASVPYWVIRNSWGSNWGENGYVRFRFGGNVCKIRSNVHYPILKTSEAAFPLLEQHNSQQKEQA